MPKTMCYGEKEENDKVGTTNERSTIGSRQLDSVALPKCRGPCQ